MGFSPRPAQLSYGRHGAARKAQATVRLADPHNVRNGARNQPWQASMIRTGAQYREGLRDGREVWIDGERVGDVTAHPALRPVIDIRARMYDMQHEQAYA